MVGFKMKITFPEDFKFGTATSAFQIEGALNEDGRGELIWDRLLRSFNFDPNIACDHYHRYPEDIKLMKKMGIRIYRFSISWTRILPKGVGKINPKGIKFYNNLIDELVSNDIKPLATLSHFDLPYPFYEKGGWKNEDMINAYKQYATICFENFSDKINEWITFNEPWVDQYLIPNNMMKSSPKKSGDVFADCLNSIHNLYKAQAEAIKIFRSSNEKGKIGITLNLAPGYPFEDSDEDIKAAKQFDEFLNAWFLDLALKGKYPKDLFDYFQDTVKAPNITKEDMNLIEKNQSDFIGVNYYGPFIIKSSENNFPMNYDFHREERSKKWANNAKVDPKGLYEILIRINENYNSPLIYITENGCSFGDEEYNDIKDEWRIDYLKRHLKEIKRAIDHGAKIKRYYVWSFMDNLEWIDGYKERYGIVYIDRSHNLERKIKKSGKWYSKLITDYQFDI
ncbi:MAG: glycosyl hydrolase family protein [Promethearchaeota archaeon]|nr:MAG: glycosyl hydrolase family protein [Candidatus Lokiarchaeota archaeon]